MAEDEEFKPSDYNKFCGLGVYQAGNTPYGIQVKLIKSSVQTPAMRVGLKDGDVINAVFKDGQWRPMQNMQDFFGYLGGIEGLPIQMRIVRGIPLPKEEMGYRGRGGNAPPPRWEGVTPQWFETKAIRARVYPHLPSELANPVDMNKVQFRDLETLLECVPMSFNDFEQDRMLATPDVRPGDKQQRA